MLSFKDEHLHCDLIHGAINGTRPFRLSWQVRHRRAGTKIIQIRDGSHSPGKKRNKKTPSIVIAEGTVWYFSHAVWFDEGNQSAALSRHVGLPWLMVVLGRGSGQRAGRGFSPPE